MWIIKILHRNLHTLRCTCSQSTKACNNLSHPSSPSVKPQMNQLACLCVQHSQNATTHNNRSDNIVQLLGASKRWLHLRVEDWTKFLWHHAHKKPMLLLFSYKLSWMKNADIIFKKPGCCLPPEPDIWKYIGTWTPKIGGTLDNCLKSRPNWVTLLHHHSVYQLVCSGYRKRFLKRSSTQKSTLNFTAPS